MIVNAIDSLRCVLKFFILSLLVDLVVRIYYVFSTRLLEISYRRYLNSKCRGTSKKKTIHTTKFSAAAVTATLLWCEHSNSFA